MSEHNINSYTIQESQQPETPTKSWVKIAVGVAVVASAFGVYKSHALVSGIKERAVAESWNPDNLQMGGLPLINERVSVVLGKQPGDETPARCELFFGVGDIYEARPYLGINDPSTFVGRLEQKTDSGNVTTWLTNPDVNNIVASKPECFGEGLDNSSDSAQELAVIAATKGFTGIDIVNTPEGKERVAVGRSLACRAFFGIETDAEDKITGSFVKIEDNNGKYVFTTEASPEKVDSTLSDLC